MLNLFDVEWCLFIGDLHSCLEIMTNILDKTIINVLVLGGLVWEAQAYVVGTYWDSQNCYNILYQYVW